MSGRPSSSSRTVCIVQPSANLDGSAFSGLLLADGLRRAGYRIHVLFAQDGPMLERYRTAGHAVAVVPHKSWLRTSQYLRFLKHGWHEWKAAGRLRIAIERVGADLVYVNSVVSLAGAIAGKQAGLPVVWHLRELFEDVGGEMKAPPLFRCSVPAAICRYADRIVAISAAVSRNLLGARSAAADIVSNAGGREYDAADRDDDDTRESLRARLNLPSDAFVLGVPGSLRPMKGHPFLLGALPAVVRTHPELKVLVTGDGDPAYRNELESLVDALALRQHVRFLGNVVEMASFYRACDVVCIPSRAEPFGRTVIESFSFALPVVASRVGGIREIIEDEIDGVLVDYGDTAELTTRLLAVIGSQGERSRIGNGARKKYDRLYRTDVYQDRICEIVNGLLQLTTT